MPEAIDTFTLRDVTYTLRDVIKLRAGGPRMNPTEFGTNDRGQPTVSCQWFAGDKLGYGTFLTESVEKVSNAVKRGPGHSFGR